MEPPLSRLGLGLSIVGDALNGFATAGLSSIVGYEMLALSAAARWTSSRTDQYKTWS